MVTEPASPPSLWQMWLRPWAAHLYRCGCPSRLPSQAAASATLARRGPHTAAAGQGLLPRNTGRSDHFMLGTPSSTHGDRRRIRSRSPPPRPGRHGQTVRFVVGMESARMLQECRKGTAKTARPCQEWPESSAGGAGPARGGEEPSTSGGQVGGSILCRVGRDRGGERARDPEILDTGNWKGTESERSVGAGQ